METREVIFLRMCSFFVFPFNLVAAQDRVRIYPLYSNGLTLDLPFCTLWRATLLWLPLSIPGNLRSPFQLCQNNVKERSPLRSLSHTNDTLSSSLCHHFDTPIHYPIHWRTQNHNALQEMLSHERPFEKWIPTFMTNTPHQATRRMTHSSRFHSALSYATALWSACYGLLGLFWTLGGPGFPFGEQDLIAREMGALLIHLPPESTGAWIALLGLVGTLAMTRSWQHLSLHVLFLSIAWGFCFLLILIIPDGRVPSVSGISAHLPSRPHRCRIVESGCVSRRRPSLGSHCLPLPAHQASCLSWLWHDHNPNTRSCMGLLDDQDRHSYATPLHPDPLGLGSGHSPGV